MAFSLESDKPIKYVSAEGKYYTVDTPSGSVRPQIAETTLDEIRGRMGDKPAGFDFNQALQGLKNEGALRESPSLAELKTAAAEQGYGVPGSFGQTQGEIPKSQEFSKYLGETNQTFNSQTGFSGTPGQLNNSKFQQGFEQAKAAGARQTYGDIVGTPTGYTKDTQGNVFNASGTKMTLEQGKENSLPLGPNGKPLTNLENLPATQARGIIDKYVQPDNTNVQADAVMATNQAHQKYLNDFTQFQSSLNQGQTLTQQYEQLSKQLGLQSINAQLINTKAIMDGSEQDIRNEITKVGGFATDSQVLALTNARNKTMIQNYNNLLRTRDDMQKNLATMIGLAEKDRAYASQQIDRQLNFDQQQSQYADKMLANAQDSLNNTAKMVGWDGILKSALASGDPQAIQRINSTMGNGFDLATMATQQAEVQRQSKLKATLENQKLQAEINKTNIETQQLRNTMTGTNTVNGLPQVNITSNNIPSRAGQIQFLDSLPGGPNGDLATAIKGLTSYTINPNTFPTRFFKGANAGLTQQQVVLLAKQFDPSYDETQYASRQALRTNFTSGNYSQNITALNTAVGHIASLADSFSKLGNVNFTPYNALKNAYSKVFGGGPLAATGLNLSAVSGELANVFKKSGATDIEIHNIGVVSDNSTPDQVRGYVSKAVELLASRLEALNNTYAMGMGKAKDPGFLSNEASNALIKLGQAGYEIKVPELARSPQIKLQVFHDASTDNQKLINNIIANHPELKTDPNAMINFLAQNGIEL